MTDILEAAARALYQIHLDQWSDADEDEREDARELMRIVLAAVTPLIRAAALEEVRPALEEMAQQKLLEELSDEEAEYADVGGGYDALVRKAREALRALKEQK